MPDLLLELFSEEIPARMQAKAAEDLRRLVTDGLVERGLTYGHAAAFATPRRLTLALSELTARSPDMREERKGPRVGAPDAALEGFLRSTGLTKDQLEVRADKKAEAWFAVTTRPGRPAAEIVAETVESAVRGFPWPKSMRWGAGSLRWVRPLHAILCVLSDEAGAETVPFEIDGIVSGDVTRGHRFMAPEPFAVTSFEDYAAKLLAAKVVLDPAERAERIRHDAAQLAFAQGLEVVEDARLLTEIAGLVEWPVTLMGRIDAAFLDLPPEVLQTSMREHQKFLSVRDPATARIVGYIVVANRETPDDGATILAGNARVLAARLSDAKFFWENDLRVPLDGHGREARRRHLPQQTRLAGRAHRPHRGTRPRDRACGRRRSRPRRARRPPRQGRSRLRDGLRVPRASGRDGQVLRPRGRRGPGGRGCGGGALFAARPVRRRARPRRSRLPWPWRTSSTPLTGSGRLTKNRPARGIPSRSAGQRSA